MQACSGAVLKCCRGAHGRANTATSRARPLIWRSIGCQRPEILPKQQSLGSTQQFQHVPYCVGNLPRLHSKCVPTSWIRFVIARAHGSAPCN
jgi:hypothetical protein